MKKTIFIILLLVNLFGNQSDSIKIYTEHYPPHNMKLSGKLTGYSVDLLAEILKDIKSNQSIKEVKLTNWSRAYSIALKVPNSMVFSTTRTLEREKLFKWVGPISTTSVGVIAPKSKNIIINKMTDFNKYKIGAVLKDVAEQLLLKGNVNKNNIQHVNGENAINLSFTKMEKGRIDMFAYNIDSAFDGAKMEGFDIDKYEVIYKLTIGELYYAFNKKTDDKIIQKWQESLDKIKENGTYDEIMMKYKRQN